MVPKVMVVMPELPLVRALCKGQVIADTTRVAKASEMGKKEVVAIGNEVEHVASATSTASVLVDESVVSPAVDRICWLDFDRGCAGLIEVTATKANPRMEGLIALEQGLENGTIRVLEKDPWMALPLLGYFEGRGRPDFIKKEEKRIKDREIILDQLIGENEKNLFDPKERNAIFIQFEEKGLASCPTSRQIVRKYYQGGMTTNALVTNYQNSGGPGKRRKAGDKRRGRPVKPENKGGPTDGRNISLKEADLLYKGYKKFYLSGKVKSISLAYNKTLDLYFAIGYELVHGAIQPILPKEESYPTYGEFYYYGTGTPEQRRALVGRLDVKEINLKAREVMGSSRKGITGPGAQFQVDWTGALVHVVSRKNRAVRIGKGIIYAISDTYSQYVPAFILALENASYIVLAALLERTFTSMSQFWCSKGFEVSEEEWPAGVICESLLADRGSAEMGYSLEDSAKALKFKLATTPPGKADWKAFIERRFGGVKQETEDIPGATSGPKERQSAYEPDEACLNLDEHELILIRHFYDFNNDFEVKNHPDAIHLLAEGLALTPFNFWNWGKKNRSGNGRKYEPDYVRKSLLPRKEVSATPEGLAFLGLAYDSLILREQGEFLRLAGHKRRRFLICYDPRDLSVIWLFDNKLRIIEVCPLTEKYNHFIGISLWELMAIRSNEAPYRRQLNTRNIENSVGRQNFMQQLVENAQQEQQLLGVDSATYDADERAREQSERRRQDAWTNTVSSSDRQDDTEEPDETGTGNYIDRPDYEALLVDDEEDW